MLCLDREAECLLLDQIVALPQTLEEVKPEREPGRGRAVHLLVGCHDACDGPTHPLEAGEAIRQTFGVNSGAAATLGKVAAEELRRARLIVRVGSEDVAITWSTRNEILKFLQRAPETLHVVLYFENVGGRRPVDLDHDGKQHLFRALRYWHDHPAIGKPFPDDAQALLAALADEEAS